MNKIECPICLNEIESDNICRTECNHQFCTECLTKWLLEKKKLTCPSCRERVKSYQRGIIVYQLLVIENNNREVIIVNPTDNPNKILVNKYLYRTLQLCSILSCLSSINYIYLMLY